MTAGIDVEKSWIEGLQHSFTYNSAGMMLTDTPVSAERSISNVAPEIGLLWKPSIEWQYRARVGTGFGIPQFGNLFVTPEGVPGNNTELKTQKNIGYDLGVDWTPLPKVMLSLTGFYEFFENEFVSQSAGPGLMNYTYNVPRSEHRGIEVAADIAITKGLPLYRGLSLRRSVLYEIRGAPVRKHRALQPGRQQDPGRDAERTDHAARLRSAFWTSSRAPERSSSTRCRTVSSWRTLICWSRLATTSSTSTCTTAPTLAEVPLRSLMAYAEIRNVFDETYISSANNITDRIGSTPTTLAAVSGSIYSGAPRSYFAGFKMRF